MELNEYQSKAMTTCMESSKNIEYMLLNLAGEVGELTSKVAKQIRKGNAYLTDYGVECANVSNEELTLWKKEAGDVLWQLAGFCDVMGWKLDDVAQMNLDKLQARKAEGTIDGNGDITRTR